MRAYGSAVALFVAATIVGCSGASSSLPASNIQNVVSIVDSGVRPMSGGSQAALSAKASYLYVMTHRCANFQPPCISEYAPGQFSTAYRVIRFKNDEPVGMAFDRASNLYVAVLSRSRVVAVYASGHTNVLRLLTGPGCARALAFNNSGNLYVLTEPCTGEKPGLVASIAVYAPGATKPNRVINNVLRNPKALMFDASGNLFVASSQAIAVFLPGKTRASHTISARVNGLSSMSVDSTGRLYVSNYGKVGESGSVTIYSPKTWRLQQTITNAIVNPNAVAISPSGSLFVTNSCASNYSSSCNNFSVSIYKGQPLKLSRRITDGLSLPHYIAFGPSGYLYVSNCQNCSHDDVNVYAPGGSTVVHQIGGSPYAAGPDGMAFGPK